MRSKRIDIIKGIGIVLVVLGHTQIKAEGFFSLFHVGLFFTASGFCFSEKNTDSFETLITYLKKSVQRLYLPYVFFNIVFLLLRNLFNMIGIYINTAMRANVMLEQIGKILLMQENELLAGPCWFVRALFVLRILFATIDFICKKISAKYIWRFRAAISLAFLAAGGYFNRNDMVLMYDFSTVCSVYVLFTWGLLLKKVLNTSNGKVFLLSSGWNAVFFVLGLAVLLSLNQYATILYVKNDYPNILFFLTAAVAGWGVCWAAAGGIEKIRVLSDVFCYFGARTMSIMMLHLSGFKFVSLAYILVKRLEWSRLSVMHVINTEWWIAYFLIGLAFPILLDEIWDRMETLITRNGNMKKIVIVICLILLVLVNIGIFIRTGSAEANRNARESAPYTGMDFSLVYDKEYYLEEYPDVAEAYAGKSDVDIFQHFLDFGMKEGRCASANFNPYYYRQAYPDLWAAYGDDMEKYYFHYIMHGYAENRDGFYDVRK